MSVTGVALSLIALVVTCRGREVAAGERGEEGGGEGEEQGRCDTESDCASLGPGPSSLPEEWTCEAAPLPTPHATVVAAPPTRIVRRPRLTCPSGTTAGRVRSRGSRTTRTAWTRVAAPRRRLRRDAGRTARARRPARASAAAIDLRRCSTRRRAVRWPRRRRRTSTVMQRRAG